MLFHVVYAHPVDSSYAAALFRTAVQTLIDHGHEVDALDLYADGFEPRLSREERMRYHDTDANRTGIEDYVARLQRADGLLLVFPVWNFGPPAILKGWFDRVLVPGVSFDLAAGKIRPALTNIKRFGVVTTYGQQSWIVRWVIGDPVRKQIMRALRRCFGSRARTFWLAFYDMNRATDAQRQAFLDRVQHRLEGL